MIPPITRPTIARFTGLLSKLPTSSTLLTVLFATSAEYFAAMAVCPRAVAVVRMPGAAIAAEPKKPIPNEPRPLAVLPIRCGARPTFEGTGFGFTTVGGVTGFVTDGFGDADVGRRTCTGVCGGGFVNGDLRGIYRLVSDYFR